MQACAGSSRVSAAAKLFADIGGVVAGNGANGNLGVLRVHIPQKRGNAYALNGAQEAGDVVHIVLTDADFLLHRLGQGANGHFPVLQQLEMVYYPGLQTQLCQGIGVKELAIPLENVCAGGGAVGGYIKGVGSGVGKAEAAGVRGNAHIHRLCHLLVRLYAHIQQKLPNDLRAGGRFRVYILVGRVFPAGAVVVDPQVNAVFHFCKGTGQHTVCCHIHGNQGIALLRLGLGKALQQRGVKGRDLVVVEHMGGFAQAAQTQTKGGGRADGVSVGLPVGQNGEPVSGQKPVGALSSRQFLHLFLPLKS